ncbi:hypothetical protein K437DRAFT_256036 [Tilletiaria anomala UBC 951]|uniref:Uncharacterized protein n=1 Tax=Tilletiaria anomala (strain ATCC 24038 / CBS 436.72 / UBC 951) TaxID=1037660 RepID=A0A066VZU8_TILAU|nr:uncharacterized protein K437DRAFT_256036 [Tilletiaria anomala UBC 951]KDN47011.1 hypothetical protein K437DRAFT_256036 [Tilletiaria anomala UBC 951]
MEAEPELCLMHLLGPTASAGAPGDDQRAVGNNALLLMAASRRRLICRQRGIRGSITAMLKKDRVDSVAAASALRDGSATMTRLERTAGAPCDRSQWIRDSKIVSADE